MATVNSPLTIGMATPPQPWLELVFLGVRRAVSYKIGDSASRSATDRIVQRAWLSGALL
jgi:hypothetical protein